MAPSTRATNRSGTEAPKAPKSVPEEPSTALSNSAQKPKGITKGTKATKDSKNTKVTKATKVAKVVKRRPKKKHAKVLGPPQPEQGSSARKNVSPFLALPPELRNMIYEYTFTSDEGFVKYSSFKNRFNFRKIGAGLTLTCHQIAAETKHLPLRLNSLHFDGWGFIQWHRKLLAAEAAMGFELKLNDLVIVKDEGRQPEDLEEYQRYDD